MKLRPTALFIKLFESLLKETAGEYFMAAFEGEILLGEPEGVYVSSGFFTGDCNTMKGFCLNGSDMLSYELPWKTIFKYPQMFLIWNNGGNKKRKLLIP